MTETLEENKSRWDREHAEDREMARRINESNIARAAAAEVRAAEYHVASIAFTKSIVASVERIATALEKIATKGAP